MKKIYIILTIIALLSMTFVAAGPNGDTPRSLFITEDVEVARGLQQHQFKFEEKYNFTCPNECNYTMAGEEIKIQARHQKRFLFFTVNLEEDYILNPAGQVVRANYNFWSLLLNQERLVPQEVILEEQDEI